MRKIIIICIFFAGGVFAKGPFDLKHIFPEDMHGWFGIPNRKHLKDFIQAKKPKKVVEIGTWLGVSAIFMAKLLGSTGKLYCIDPWLPYHDMEGMMDCQQRMEYAYERFLSNCIHHQVTDKIIPLRMASMQAIDQFESDIDLIYIDGSHQEEDAYNDIIHWYPKLSSQGIMCGDDIGWPGVYAALMRAAPILGVTVRRDDNFWWFE